MTDEVIDEQEIEIADEVAETDPEPTDGIDAVPPFDGDEDMEMDLAVHPYRMSRKD